MLALVSGANRADEARVAASVGEPIESGRRLFVRPVTSYSIGGIPPLGHPAPVRTLLDEDLLRFEVVWAAAGRPPGRLFPITPAVLAEKTGATVRRLAEGWSRGSSPLNPGFAVIRETRPGSPRPCRT